MHIFCTPGICHEAGISPSITPHSLFQNLCRYTAFPQVVKRGKTSQQMSRYSGLSFTLVLLQSLRQLCCLNQLLLLKQVINRHITLSLKMHSSQCGHFPLSVYRSPACLIIGVSKFQLQSALFGCCCCGSVLISIGSCVISRMALSCPETVL